jgi:Helicase C-terminal domain/DEAD/DEAH box helicase
MSSQPYEALFARHRSAEIPSLWPWQSEVLAAYASLDGDAAVELPTGTGKTLIGLLAGEDYRDTRGEPVAYLAGNKQLAQQIERHARDLGFPIVRFQGRKDTWAPRDVRAYNFGESIGVMNYWNYFNARPGVDPAGMVILDDVHLLESPLRDLFTVFIRRSDPLNEEILQRIVASCPYYSLAVDLLHGVEPQRPPEMLVPLDSAELADEVRDLIDARLPDGTAAWWAWQRMRDRLQVCCWIISTRGTTFTPYIPPSQTLEHFERPARRLYLSATIGSADDLQRRLGTPPLTKLTSSVQPRQGERLVVIRDGTDVLPPTEMIDELRPFLDSHPKALWLCARRETAQAIEAAIVLAGFPGTVRRLEEDNGADEAFAADVAGHLLAAGRYDGMDFPGDTCRVEILPEVPVATSDLEEFVSAYLRDAPFAEARLAQRVAQALGRCNRRQDDRAVYLLADPEFQGRFSQRRILDALPDGVRGDVFAGLERADGGFAAGLDDAQRFLGGESVPLPRVPTRAAEPTTTTTAGDEVNGTLALWREDYGRAAGLFDRVAVTLAQAQEHRAFWLAQRALALRLAARYGDRTAHTEARAALRAAATAGAVSTFFTRLRLSESRLEGATTRTPINGYDELFVAWDRLIDRLGAQGPRFDKWLARLVADLRSADHDAVARAVADVGSDLLGLSAAAPQPTAGQEDAHWELAHPRRMLCFEVKLAPILRRVINDDIEQAEGAARAMEVRRSCRARGLLLTPHNSADATAQARLERVRLLQIEVFIDQVERLAAVMLDYRRGWTADASSRAARRRVVDPDLPALDWLWQAVEHSKVWLAPPALHMAWQSRDVGGKV